MFTPPRPSLHHQGSTRIKSELKPGSIHCVASYSFSCLLHLTQSDMYPYVIDIYPCKYHIYIMMVLNHIQWITFITSLLFISLKWDHPQHSPNFNLDYLNFSHSIAVYQSLSKLTSLSHCLHLKW